MTIRTKCPKCGSDKLVKNGTSRGSPLRRCNNCGLSFSAESPMEEFREARKKVIRQKLELGKNKTEIAREIGITPNSVYRFIRLYGIYD